MSRNLINKSAEIDKQRRRSVLEISANQELDVIDCNDLQKVEKGSLLHKHGSKLFHR